MAGLIPKQQFLLKRPHLAKVVNLHVHPTEYWLYTNSPYDVGKLNARMSISVLGGSLPVDPTVGFDSSLGVANELKATLGVFCMGRPVGIAPPTLTESKCYPTCVYNLHAREDCCSDTIR